MMIASFLRLSLSHGPPLLQVRSRLLLIGNVCCSNLFPFSLRWYFCAGLVFSHNSCFFLSFSQSSLLPFSLRSLLMLPMWYVYFTKQPLCARSDEDDMTVSEFHAPTDIRWSAHSTAHMTERGRDRQKIKFPHFFFSLLITISIFSPLCVYIFVCVFWLKWWKWWVWDYPFVSSACSETIKFATWKNINFAFLFFLSTTGKI